MLVGMFGYIAFSYFFGLWIVNFTIANLFRFTWDVKILNWGEQNDCEMISFMNAGLIRLREGM